MANITKGALAAVASAPKAERLSSVCSVLTLSDVSDAMLALAQIAAANLRPGDRFRIGLRVVTILRAEQGQISYAYGPTIARTAVLGGSGWKPFIALLANELTSTAAPGRAAFLKILLRDPAVTINAAGMPHLL